MLHSPAFKPEQQFHVLINLKGDDHCMAVLPNDTGDFLVIEQGNVLGLLQFNKCGTCISTHGQIEAEVIAQLTDHIKDHYSLPYAIA
jgi:hypothetical protein